MTRLARLALAALVVCLLNAAGAGMAQAQQTRAIFELIVNGIPKGDTIVYLASEDVWVPGDTLVDVGLQSKGTRQTIDGVEHVSLKSLSPEIGYRLDEQALTLDLEARPGAFGPTKIALQAPRPAGIVYDQTLSAFLNYAVNVRSRGEHDAFAETGLSIAGASLSTTFIGATGGGLDRGLSNLVMDDRRRLVRWTIGDSFTQTGLLGGGLFLGGISFAREYSLDPYFIRYPTLGLAGATPTPSTIEVYVNNQIVRRLQVPAGEFELSRLPVSSGRGEAHIVVRDAFGREQQIGSEFYATPSVLGRGVHEFRYDAGLRRNDVGRASWDYGPWAFLGRHRLGLTDWLTLGGRLEGSEGLVSGGPNVTARFPYGEIDVHLGTSRHAGATGTAMSAAYSLTTRPFSLGAMVTALSSRYATTSLASTDDRAWREGQAFVSAQVGSDRTITVRQALSHRLSGDARESTAVSFYTPATSRTSLSITGSRMVEPKRHGFELFLALHVFMGQTSGTFSHERTLDGPVNRVDVQRALPTGEGWGYQLRLSDGDRPFAGGAIQYQGPHGRYELIQDRVNGLSSTTLNVAGAIVGIGGGVYATRPVQESFALVRVPGVKGVRAYASNQEAGTTDASGNVLVPNLLAYYGNELSIDDVDIPLDFGVARVESTVAPPFRGGALVMFPVRRLQTMTGSVSLVVGGEPVIPVYGQLIVRAGLETFESPIGTDGAFYFENVPPGPREATVEFRRLRCRFVLTVPTSSETHLSLGEHVCPIQEVREP
jgi:outer membrane usher protein